MRYGWFPFFSRMTLHESASSLYTSIIFSERTVRSVKAAHALIGQAVLSHQPFKRRDFVLSASVLQAWYRLASWKRGSVHCYWCLWPSDKPQLQRGPGFPIRNGKLSFFSCGALSKIISTAPGTSLRYSASNRSAHLKSNPGWVALLLQLARIASGVSDLQLTRFVDYMLLILWYDLQVLPRYDILCKTACKVQEN